MRFIIQKTKHEFDVPKNAIRDEPKIVRCGRIDRNVSNLVLSPLSLETVDG